MSLRRLPWVWGEPIPLPEHHTGDVRIATRAIRTDAQPEALYLWLCQLRRAPYSYDLVDNFGRRSPRTADPALQDLAPGQTFMTIFTLRDFEPDHGLTITMNPGWSTTLFGAITVRYRIDQPSTGETRLSAQLQMPPVPGPLGGLRRYLLAWGDVVMMRKQLRVLSRLASNSG
jgi:hypothetical protein